MSGMSRFERSSASCPDSCAPDQRPFVRSSVREGTFGLNNLRGDAR